ncbi:hypothetical protein SNE40_022359 [Patella caerulea]|uniref:Uncharacterized protein n=1 Tax=Patella caerulea TaxID=87958 RepID=A0AAN8GAR7_PATCE
MADTEVQPSSEKQSSEIINDFFNQAMQCDRVTNSLLYYIKTMRLMKVAYRHVNIAMLGLCPKQWAQRDHLKVCLEDQGEVLSVAEGLIRSLFPRLKSHSRVITDTQALLADLEQKIEENKTMHATFEDMKKRERITRQQEEQIRFMLRDTDRALEMISGNVATRLHDMNVGAMELVKDIIMKFQEVQKIISSENLEIIGVIATLTSTLPKPKCRIRSLDDSQSLRIIDEFNQSNDLYETKQRKIAAHKAQLDKSKKESHQDGAPTSKPATATSKTPDIPDYVDDTEDAADEINHSKEEERQAAHQQMSYDRNPLESHTVESGNAGAATHTFEAETEYADGGRRNNAGKRPVKKGGYPERRKQSSD